MSYSKTFGNVLIFLVVLAAIFLGYKYFIVGSDEEAVEVGVTPLSENSGEMALADEFVNILNSLNSVDLKAAAFLDDPVFTESLKDFSDRLPEIPVGRENPFAAIGVGGGAPARAVTASSTKKTNRATTTENLEIGTQESQL